FSTLRPPPRSTLFPYTTLFRSTLDIAMGGSTNTILHLLAAAQEAEVNFDLHTIDEISHKVPQLCKVAPNTPKYHIEDVHRAGGIDRKSTRLNSSHVKISYAVFC